jgi:hypothetical protein
MAAEDEGGVPIAAVEQATGIARATLRIWERRYGFPQPARDPRGERSYPGEQVSKLRLIADLMADGHRPGGLVQLTAAELSSLSGPRERRRSLSSHLVPDDPVLVPLRAHDLGTLVHLLQEGVHALGAAAFVCERMPHMNLHVGLAWARGELQVYEEHLYSEAVQQVVRAEILARHAIAAVPAPACCWRPFPTKHTASAC